VWGESAWCVRGARVSGFCDGVWVGEMGRRSGSKSASVVGESGRALMTVSVDVCLCVGGGVSASGVCDGTRPLTGLVLSPVSGRAALRLSGPSSFLQTGHFFVPVNDVFSCLLIDPAAGLYAGLYAGLWTDPFACLLNGPASGLLTSFWASSPSTCFLNDAQMRPLAPWPVYPIDSVALVGLHVCADWAEAHRTCLQPADESTAGGHYKATDLSPSWCHVSCWPGARLQPGPCWTYCCLCTQ